MRDVGGCEAKESKKENKKKNMLTIDIIDNNIVACKPLCYVSEFNGIGNAAAASFSHCLVSKQASDIGKRIKLCGLSYTILSALSSWVLKKTIRHRK